MAAEPPPGWHLQGVPPPLPPRPRRYRWWHRLHGHHTRARYDLLEARAAWERWECELIIGSI